MSVSDAESGFKTISVVSKELDVPQYVLRFWEKQFTQIAPVKRKGGRRYYRASDVENIRKIKSLLYDKGYTIKGVKSLLRDKSVSPEEKTTPQVEKYKKDQKIKAVLSALVELREMVD